MTFMVIVWLGRGYRKHHPCGEYKHTWELAFIAPFAWFVNCNIQRVLSEFVSSNTMDGFVDTGGRNEG